MQVRCLPVLLLSETLKVPEVLLLYMGQKRTQDSTDVSDGLQALDEMSPRRHNDSRNEVHSCRCGAMVVVPKGHVVLEDEDKEVECHACDAPLGQKIYDALR